MKIDIPSFESKSELHKFLVENKGFHLAQAKMMIKEADAFLGLAAPYREAPFSASKAEGQATGKENEITVKAIINTTNVIDSHKDLHIPGLWNKTLKENKRIMHLKEHSRKFEDVISRGR